MTLYQQSTGSPLLYLTLTESESQLQVQTNRQLESEKAYIRDENTEDSVTIYADFADSLKNCGDPTLLDFINYSINRSGEVTWYSFPEINVSVTTINMSKNWGDESLSTFRIYSIGNTELEVDFVFSDQNFSLTSYNITVEGGTYADVKVNFTPSYPGNFSAILTLNTNDMETQQINITLTGYATAPRFNSTFAGLSFETDTTYEFSFVINNSGNGDLKITKISEPWWITLNVSASTKNPLIVPKNTSLIILARTYFRTEPNDIYSGLIEFTCNDPQNSIFSFNITAKWTGAPKEEEESTLSIYIIIAIIASVVGGFAVLGVRGYQSGMTKRKFFYMLVALLVLMMTPAWSYS